MASAKSLIEQDVEFNISGEELSTTLFITWLQYRTKQAMLGRVMSLLMFAVIGLNPISMSISGFFLNICISGTFMAAGVLMSVLVLIALMNDDDKAISFL